MNDEVSVDRIDNEQLTSVGVKATSTEADLSAIEVSDHLQRQHSDDAVIVSSIGGNSTWQLEFNSQTTVNDIYNHVSNDLFK